MFSLDLFSQLVGPVAFLSLAAAAFGWMSRALAESALQSDRGPLAVGFGLLSFLSGLAGLSALLSALAYGAWALWSTLTLLYR